MSGCHDHVSDQAETRRALISCPPRTDTAWLICKTSAKKKKKRITKRSSNGHFLLGCDITSGWEMMWFFFFYTALFFAAWRKCRGEKKKIKVVFKSPASPSRHSREQEERNRAVLVRNDADRRLQRWRTNGKQVDLCCSGGLHSSEECETATSGVWTQTGCHIITTHGPPNHLRTNGHKIQRYWAQSELICDYKLVARIKKISIPLSGPCCIPSFFFF